MKHRAGPVSGFGLSQVSFTCSSVKPFSYFKQERELVDSIKMIGKNIFNNIVVDFLVTLNKLRALSPSNILGAKSLHISTYGRKINTVGF